MTGRAVPESELRFRALFDNQFRPLLGYALRRTDSPDDAADVVAETMLVAWRRIGEVPVDGTARLWLYGVARRVLANQRRGGIRREHLAERIGQTVKEITPDPADLVDSTTVVQEAMAGLSENDRELILLTGWEGLDPSEAAVVLGLPAGTVRTRLHRARSKLRRSVGDAFDDHGPVSGNHQANLAKEER